MISRTSVGAGSPRPHRPPRPRVVDLLPLALLLLFPTLLLWRVVFAGDVFLPADLLRDIAPWRAANPSQMVPWNPLMWDGMAEFYPWRLFAAESLRAGWIPLWNPHQFCGTPFVANSQSAVFYPLNLLFCVMPVARAFGVSVWLHLALTGLFLYGFLRSGAFQLSAPAALVGAVAWQMSAWQVSWLALPTFVCVSCWLPLALWLAWRAVRPPAPNPGGAGRWAALGVCLGVMVLAGHLQIALYGIGLTACYTLFLLWPQRRLPLGVFMALGLMLGLAAPQLLPAVELARVSHRAGTPVTWQSYQNYVSLGLPPINLLTLFLPGFFGSPTQGTYWGVMTNGGPSAYVENACYIGILALGLAFLGVGKTWRRSPQTRFFTVAAVVALLMALGTPLDALLYFGLPGFSQSGSPGRVLVVWTLCASVLAAVGAEALVTGAVRRGRATWGTGAAFGTAFVLSLGGTIFWITRFALAGALQRNLPLVGDLWRVPAGIFLGAAALLWLRHRGTLTSPTMGLLLALLAGTDLLAANWGYNRTAAISQVYPTTPGLAYLQQHAGTDRLLALNHGWSIEGNRPPPAILPPNTATVYGLNDVAGYDSLLTRRAFQFVGALDAGRNPAPQENGNLVFTSDYASSEAQEADARYVVSQTPLTDSSLKLLLQDGPVFLYQNAKALPHVRWEDGRPAGTVSDEAPTRVSVSLGPPGAGDVELADQWYPGWQARIGDRGWDNGKQADITLEQGMFRRVAPGANPTVEMRYLPTTFRVGLYGLCLALAVAGGLASVGLARRLSRRRGG